MARRKTPKAVQEIFDKYIENHVRHLHKDDAIAMLQKEFDLTTDQADQMFEHFDKDKNGLMSIWEFQQFYEVVGNTGTAMVQKFQEIDKDGSGKLDVDEAREGLKSMTDAGGRVLEDKEIEFFIKSSIGEDNLVDLGAFADLLFRLKLYKAPPKKPAKK